MIFQSIIGKQKPTIFLGSPEAEGESTSNSRISIFDVYEDFHGLLTGLSQEKFMVIGRKGSGKSAFGEYVYAKSLNEPNLFCEFVKKNECNLEKAVQWGESAGINVEIESLFRWIIYTNILKMFVENLSIEDTKEYALLTQFLRKNSGYIKINELETKHLIEKNGFDVSVEQFKRFFHAKFNKNIETKSERAPYFKLLPHLEDVIKGILKSKDNVENENSYVLFFDDLDVGFSTDNPASVEATIGLIRACRYVNNEIFGKHNIKAKAIILLRDDIEAYLSTRYADSAKIFSSYSSRIDWYQDAYASSQKDENELNLKKFINKRIAIAFEKAGLDFDKSDPWNSLVGQTNEKSSFKYVVNQTLFRPRDLLLFFLPLESGQFSYPLGRHEISTLVSRYAEELAKEVKNELSSFYSFVQVETIFRAVGALSERTHTFDEAVAIVKDNCTDLDEESVLEYMFDRSILGNVDTNNWYTFKCRQSTINSSQGGLNRRQKIVIQYGIQAYVKSRGYL